MRNEPRNGRIRAIVSAAVVGLILAPLTALVVYFLIPDSIHDDSGVLVSTLPNAGRAVAAVGALMAVLWVTEAIPIAATALIPIALFPLLTVGEVSIGSAAAPYADKLIFLFMGGFMIALAMQRWELHRRIALLTILIIGTRPVAMVGGFMVARPLLSMWVSNTATVVMMLPIAMSVIELVRRGFEGSGDPDAPQEGKQFNFAICLMLGTAYAASIGGIGTLIGTPPNLMLAGFLEKTYGIELSFAQWMAAALPLVVVFLPITWLLLTRVVFPIRLPRSVPGGRELIRRELREQGHMSQAEWSVLIIFLFTAAAWITRRKLAEWTMVDGSQPLAGLSDTGIAIIAALVLFSLPANGWRGRRVLSWEQAVKLPWGILILFGGGLSLAAAIDSTGVAGFIGYGVRGLDALPVPVLVLIITATVVFLTELTSNTATTATFLPILGAIAIGLGINPMLLVVPMAIGASCAFMMPVATPPNAIVFSSGEISIPQMCKAGLWLNLIGIGLVMALMYTVIIHVLKIEITG